jgi:polysaccharide biosynthesis protein PslG
MSVRKQLSVIVTILLSVVVLLVGISFLTGPSAAASANAQATFGAVVGPGDVTPEGANPELAQATIPPTASPAPTTPPATAAATQAATVDFTPTPTLPKLNKSLMGIQAYGYNEHARWGELMDRALHMGFRWMKFQLSWKELEPSKGEYSPQFEVLVQNVFDMTQFSGAQFKIMLSVAKAPDWARPAGARGQADGPPANPQDLIDFINHVYDRLPAEHISAFEIWNEPNLQTEWTGAPLNGASYVQMFTPVYNAIRARGPNTVVITAGPTPVGATNVTMDDRQWLQEIYSAGLPLGDPNFAIGAHPYGWANAPDSRCCANPSKGWDDHPSFYFLDTIYAYRDIMVKNNHAQGKLWATEFGWSSFDGLKEGSHVDGKPAMPPPDEGLAWLNRITEEQQGHYIVRAYELAQTGDLAGFMGPMFLWNLNFSVLTGYVKSEEPSRPEVGFSVINQNTFPRKAYELLQAATKD